MVRPKPPQPKNTRDGYIPPRPVGPPNTLVRSGVSIDSVLLGVVIGLGIAILGIRHLWL